MFIKDHNSLALNICELKSYRNMFWQILIRELRIDLNE